jgi:mannose-6-phosphate isomerase class I
MKHVRFEPTEPQILPDAFVQENVYNSSAAEFELSRIQLQEGEEFTLTSATAETLLVMEGAVTVQGDAIEIILTKGEAALIIAGTHLEIRGASAAQLFRAAVPDVEKRAT